jgi:hypothetical protein
VVLTWTAPVNIDVAQDASNSATYCVLRATVTGGTVGTFGGFGNAATTGNTFCQGGNNNANRASGGAAPSTTLTDKSGVPGTTYVYEVFAQANGNNGGQYSAASAASGQASVPATAAKNPISISSVTTQGTNTGNNAAILDTGDTLQFVFTNVSSTVPLLASAGASVTLADNYGAQVSLTNGSNASFTISGSGTVLNISVTGAPTLVTPASPGNASPTPLNLNTDVTDAVGSETGITNAAGDWNLPASGCHASANGCDSTVVQRSFRTAGTTNFNSLPNAIWWANIAAKAPNKVDITTSGANSFDGNGRFLATGDPVAVFDSTGKQIGTRTWDSALATNTITTTTTFSPGDMLFVVWVDTASASTAQNKPSISTEVTASFGSYMFAPSPIAASGSLGNSAPVTVTLTVRDQNGNAVPGATVYLSFSSNAAPGPGGSASVGATALTASQQAFTANGVGQVTISYTSSATSTSQTSGADNIHAQNAALSPDFVGDDSYTYGTPAPTSVTPNGVGPGSAVDVLGTKFVCTPTNPTVTFGGTAAGVTSCTPTDIGVTVPAGTAGSTVSVTVTNPNGQSGTCVNCFTYASGPPQISSARVITGGKVVRVTYNQTGIDCRAGNAATAGAFTFTDSYNGPNPNTTTSTPGTAIAQFGGSACSVTFAGLARTFNGDDFGSLDYLQPLLAADRVTNANGDAPSQASVFVTNTTSVFMNGVFSFGFSTTVSVSYNIHIKCTTVDANGSDYTVMIGAANDAVVSASCGGTITNGYSNQVDITVLVAPNTCQFVSVTSKAGSDGNTVGTTSPSRYDYIGDNVGAVTADC